MGVAVDDWTVEDLREHARKAIETPAARRSTTKVFNRFAEAPLLRPGRLRRRRHVRASGEGDRGRREPGLLPRDPAVALRHGRQGARGGGPDQGRAGRGREAVRPRPRLGSRARRRAPPIPRRVPALPDRPLPREDGPGRDPLPPVRERDVRARLEPQQRRLRADHDGGGLRGRGPRPLLRPGGRAAGRRRQPPDAGGRGGGDGAARRGDARTAEGRDVRASSAAMPTADPTQYVRGQYEGYREIDGRRRGLDHRDLRGHAARDRQLALDGRAVLHPDGKHLPVDADGAAARLQAPAAPGLPASRRRAPPEPDQLVVKLDPTTGIRLLVDAQRGDEADARADQPRHGVRGRRAARARRPYEVLLHAAMVGDSTRFTRQDSVEETWRIMQPLLDTPPRVHPYEKGSWGPKAADRARRRLRRLARPVAGS